MDSISMTSQKLFTLINRRMKKKTTEKIIVLTVTPKELEVIVSALMVIETGYELWGNRHRKEKKFVTALLNKIVP
jgi:hypothetical protein